MSDTTSNDNASKITIPPIQRAELKLWVVGRTSLLSAAMPPRIVDILSQPKGQNGKRVSLAVLEKTVTAEQRYQESLYVTDDGEYGFPSGAFRRACIDECSFLDGVTMKQVSGSMIFIGDKLPIHKSKPHPRLDIGRLRGTVPCPCYRMEYPAGWEIQLHIEYDPLVIDDTNIANLLQRAGRNIGVGAWRPQKKGYHGMFDLRRDGHMATKAKK